MRVLYDKATSPRVSIILLDWGVRESFHAIKFLENQTVARSDYEVIWIEFYDSISPELAKVNSDLTDRGKHGIDKCIILDHEPGTYIHKHFAYNVGITLAKGDICVIADSDVIYPPNFIARVMEEFASSPRLALHVDEIRNYNQRFYPFPAGGTAEEVLADSRNINWTGQCTMGLLPGADMLHEANYGACLAARRSDLLSIGGSDEDLEFLGYICGPYDLTFRLVNAGLEERWLRDLFLIHTWHPGEGGGGENYGSNHDGQNVSSLALEARRSGRTLPYCENPAIAALREGLPFDQDTLVRLLRCVDKARWNVTDAKLERMGTPQLWREGIAGCNIVEYHGLYYALPQGTGPFLRTLADDGTYARDLLHGDDLEELTRRLTGAPAGQDATATASAAGSDATSGSDTVGSPHSGGGPQTSDLATPAVSHQTVSPAPSKITYPVRIQSAERLLAKTRIETHRFPKVADDPKLITVILTYYHKESTIFACLDALRSQESGLYQNDDVETIIVDDGSLGENISRQLPEDVLYLWQRKTLFGSSRAKNTAARLANGRYLVFLDPDCIVGKGHFDAMLRGFAQFGDRVLQCGYIWDYHFVGCPDPRTEFGVWENPGYPTSRFYQVAAGNLAIARSLYCQTPGFDEDVIYGGVEDLLFGYHVGLLRDTACVFNREMEVRHIPHPPGGAHVDVTKSWEVVKAKWPEFYCDYIENGTR